MYTQLYTVYIQTHTQSSSCTTFIYIFLTSIFYPIYSAHVVDNITYLLVYIHQCINVNLLILLSFRRLDGCHWFRINSALNHEHARSCWTHYNRQRQIGQSWNLTKQKHILKKKGFSHSTVSIGTMVRFMLYAIRRAHEQIILFHSRRY